MEETKQTPNEPVQPISPEQAAEVAGGDGDCTSVSVGGVTVSGSSLTDIYEQAVDTTSYIIERVSNAL